MSILWYLNCAYDACARMLDAVRSMLVGAPKRMVSVSSCSGCGGTGVVWTNLGEITCDGCLGRGCVPMYA